MLALLGDKKFHFFSDHGCTSWDYNAINADFNHADVNCSDYDDYTDAVAV